MKGRRRFSRAPSWRVDLRRNMFRTRAVLISLDRTSEHCKARSRAPPAQASMSVEIASPDIIDLTTGPNVTGVGAGVSAGEIAFDGPDDQTCLSVCLEGERRRRNAVAPETAPAEPPRDDSESDDSDELTENVTDDDSESASSQFDSDDDELKTTTAA